MTQEDKGEGEGAEGWGTSRDHFVAINPGHCNPQDSPEESSSPFELSSAFSFLVQKRPSWSSVQSFMLVWLLRTIIDSVGIPETMENGVWGGLFWFIIFD